MNPAEFRVFSGKEYELTPERPETIEEANAIANGYRDEGCTAHVRKFEGTPQISPVFGNDFPTPATIKYYTIYVRKPEE